MMRRSWRSIILTALCITVVLTGHASVYLYYGDPGLSSSNESTGLINTAIRVQSTPGTLSAQAVSQSKPCLVVEGEVCHCYLGGYSDVVISWTDRCHALRDQALKDKGMFSYALHLHVQHTEDMSDEIPSGTPLARAVSTSPVYITRSAGGEMVAMTGSSVTLVLPLTLDDLSRAVLLLRSLQAMQDAVVLEMLVFVPSSQLSLLRGALGGVAGECHLPFPVRVLSEQVLFHASPEILSDAFPYGLQMAIKLLAADFVRTPYYLTLDADILQLHPFQLHDLLVPTGHTSDTADRAVRALYHFEERGVHETWWAGSERVLNVSAASSYVYHKWRQAGTCSDGDATCNSNSDASINDERQSSDATSPMQRRIQGFGVTPAVLSTYGSQLTVSHLCRTLTHNLDYETPIDRAECERLWLGGFARPYMTVDGGEPAGELMIWSEYTLYRIALDHYEVFDELHVSEEDVARALGDQAAESLRLHCYNVWYAAQLPWPAEEASHAANCMFTVVQSSTGVSPDTILRMYDRYFVATEK